MTRPRKVGRPRLEFDLRQVEELARIQCTDGEMAAVLGCCRDTILNRKAADPDFSAAIERGRDAGKASLRRAQWDAAMRGDRTILIWLGKQYLEQRDRSAHEHQAIAGAPISFSLDLGGRSAGEEPLS